MTEIVCPECNGQLVTDDQFDWTDRTMHGGDPPIQGIRFDCTACSAEPITAVLHYPDHRYVAIEMRAVEGNPCACGTRATWRVEWSTGTVETYCNSDVPSMYVTAFGVTRDTFRDDP